MSLSPHASSDQSEGSTPYTSQSPLIVVPAGRPAPEQPIDLTGAPHEPVSILANAGAGAGAGSGGNSSGAGTGADGGGHGAGSHAAAGRPRVTFAEPEPEPAGLVVDAFSDEDDFLDDEEDAFYEEDLHDGFDPGHSSGDESDEPPCDCAHSGDPNQVRARGDLHRHGPASAGTGAARSLVPWAGSSSRAATDTVAQAPRVIFIGSIGDGSADQQATFHLASLLSLSWWMSIMSWCWARPEDQIEPSSLAMPHPQNSNFVQNAVSTSKYTILTFLPKFLFEQFGRASNFFFLVCACLTLVPNVGVISPALAAAPLLVVIVLSAFKELIEDFLRYWADRQTNRRPVMVLRQGQFVPVRSGAICVGDTLCLAKDDAVPADIVLISTSEPQGVCFVETASIDGETNLKIRSALPITHRLKRLDQFSRLAGSIQCEQPNSRLYTFSGLAELTLQPRAGGGHAPAREHHEHHGASPPLGPGPAAGDGASACASPTMPGSPGSNVPGTPGRSPRLPTRSVSLRAQRPVASPSRRGRSVDLSGRAGSDLDFLTGPPPVEAGVSGASPPLAPGPAQLLLDGPSAGPGGSVASPRAPATDMDAPHAGPGALRIQIPASPTGGRGPETGGGPLPVASAAPTPVASALPPTTPLAPAGGDNRKLIEPYNVVLRGSHIRNTAWAVGIVVYAGQETKLFKNSAAAPIKESSLQRRLNHMVLLMFLCIVILAIILTVTRASTDRIRGRPWYLGQRTANPGTDDTAIVYTLRAILLLQNMIPLTLFFQLEIARFIQGFLIAKDPALRAPALPPPADGSPAPPPPYPPSKASTTNLNEQLGQVEHIFSDKTGTLTRNKMVFQRCVIDGLVFGGPYADEGSFMRAPYFDRSSILDAIQGTPYVPPSSMGSQVLAGTGRPRSESISSRVARPSVVDAFMVALAVCQTVIPEDVSLSAAEQEKTPSPADPPVRPSVASPGDGPGGLSLPPPPVTGAGGSSASVSIPMGDLSAPGAASSGASPAGSVASLASGASRGSGSLTGAGPGGGADGDGGLALVAGAEAEDGLLQAPGMINYRASSPDEDALVRAARSCGYFFHKREIDVAFVRVGGILPPDRARALAEAEAKADGLGADGSFLSPGDKDELEADGTSIGRTPSLAGTDASSISRPAKRSIGARLAGAFRALHAAVTGSAGQQAAGADGADALGAGSGPTPPADYDPLEGRGLGAVDRKYHVLHINDFSSARKRMSVVIELPPEAGRHACGAPRRVLFCKGADDTILSRLAPFVAGPEGAFPGPGPGAGGSSIVAGSGPGTGGGGAQVTGWDTASGTPAAEIAGRPAGFYGLSDVLHTQRAVASTRRALNTFARLGLRTLCIAWRELSPGEYAHWRSNYLDGIDDLANRDEALERASDAIERELILLGATAIEDRLQAGVPESIELLLRAGIRLWVLTGDKQETAINIAHSCRLLNSQTEIIITPSPALTVAPQVSASATGDSSPTEPYDTPNRSLVIDGSALLYIMREDAQDLRDRFLDLALQCRTVICCRVSPMQKANMVQLVRKRSSSNTLAIGDGANDVAMIQAASIGVGVHGEEGSQAVRAADYAVGQFRFLTRLLLVHGAWSYHRQSLLILYQFFIQVVFNMLLFFFQFINSLSMQTMYQALLHIFFFTVFTGLPVMLAAVLDRHLSANQLLSHPEAYRSLKIRPLFSMRVFWIRSLMATMVAGLLMLFSLAAASPQHVSMMSFGATLYTLVMLTVSAVLIVDMTRITLIIVLSLLGSLAVFIFLQFYTGELLNLSSDFYVYYRIYRQLLTADARSWVAFLAAPTTAALLLVTVKYWGIQRFPSDIQILNELKWVKLQARQWGVIRDGAGKVFGPFTRCVEAMQEHFAGGPAGPEDMELGDVSADMSGGMAPFDSLSPWEAAGRMARRATPCCWTSPAPRTRRRCRRMRRPARPAARRPPCRRLPSPRPRAPRSRNRSWCGCMPSRPAGRAAVASPPRPTGGSCAGLSAGVARSTPWQPGRMPARRPVWPRY
ncbi:hypothetical protein H696_04816 [Fonticula alba]|uniref:P-type phospholipid transporter n=1 Tax=Fonticula alba TaxID=691883 RepID=A0A058Z2N0_FONAL|nr:hypothetical protein H696_04816 [Fonticula alba]KCV68524.1 hypothetical protein H696_04816 [Fonticula alba]|eukprot:XP_009496956.1 hypothetical protein H696_04816 [Fonticula alba]